MLSRSGMIAAVVVLSAAALGCQSRVARERDELYAQNRKLQLELDEARNKPPVVVQQASEPQQPAPPVTPPAPQPPPVTPPPVAQQPQPLTPPDIEGVETEANVADGTVTVKIPGDVLFSSGQADLRAPSKQTLDRVIDVLKREYPGKTIRVEGHTDNDPIKKSKWPSNQALSEARAESVRNYLVSKGIDGGTLTTRGVGADKPRAQEKSKNRRVELVVVVR